LLAEGGRFVVDPTDRLLYLVSPSRIAVYDLDTLAPMAPVLAAPEVHLSRFAAPLFDPALGAVVVGAGTQAQIGIGAGSIVTIALQGGRVRLLGSVDISTNSLPGSTIIGMARAGQWVYALSAVAQLTGRGPTRFAAHTMELHQIDGRGLLGGPQTASQRKGLPDCMPSATSVDAAVGVVGRTILFGCGSFKMTGYVVKPAIPQGVGRVTLDQDPRSGTPTLGDVSPFELFAKNGDYVEGQSLADPVSGRLAMFWSSDTSGSSIVDLFDGRAAAWLGTAPVGQGLGLDAVAYGLNEATGRFYASVEGGGGGMGVGELRLPAVDQGHFHRDFPERGHSPHSNIGVDPLTSRLFLNFGDHVDIVVDESPPVVAGAPTDPDTNTVDVPEAAGRTGANISASAQGYGARMRLVGGIENLTTNLVSIDSSNAYSQTGPVTSQSPVPPPSPPSPYGSREIRLAYLDKLTLANGESTASAIGGWRDPATQESEAAAKQSVWPYTSITCADTGEGTKQDSTDGATVRCDAEGEIAKADAVADRLTGPGITVGKATMSAVAQRGRDGSSAEVTSIAEGVRVIGSDGEELLRIGRVANHVLAAAHGRPGTTRVDHTAPTIEKVFIRGTEYCTVQCDPRALADAVNANLTGIVRISFPRASAEASRGGYQAEYRRGTTEHAEDVVLNEQTSDRYEVPAMTITVSMDNQRPWRTIVELAAVEAEARYGIYRIGNGAADVGPAIADTTSVDNSLLGNLLTVPVDSPTEVVQLTGSHERIPGPLGQFLRILRNPLRLFWNGSPGSMFVVWAMLLSPVYLSARRWLLRRRSMLFEDVA
jgi:hypothetical protein